MSEPEGGPSRPTEAPAPTEAPIEPGDRRRARRVRWYVVILAALAAAAGWLLAPEGWDEGPAQLRLEYDDAVIASSDLAIGSGEPVDLRGRAGDRRFAVDVAEGIDAADRLEAELAVSEDGEPLRPDLERLRLVLVRDGESEELIPWLRWDEDAAVVIAQRRPPVEAGIVVALLGLVVVLWVTETVPLWVTSLLIPIVLTVFDAGTARDALAPFFHPIIALFFGGFLMAAAMRRAGLDRLIAAAIVARAGRSPLTLFAAMIGLAAFLSMWMSNTAATAVLVPIAIAVTEPLAHLGYRKAAVLGIAYAATIGGVGSAIGTPANPIAITFLDDFAGHSISFVEWFAYGLPMVVLFLPLMGAYLWMRASVSLDETRFGAARAAARHELERAGGLTRDQLVVLGVFAAVMGLWLTQTWHEVDTGIIALGGAVALAAVGRIQPEDLAGISWPSLLTFGGGLTLGVFLVESGTSDWIATELEVLGGAPEPLAVAAVGGVALILTTVASNTATAAMLIPLSVPLAAVIGIDPVLLVIVVAIASSVDFALVIGTPPTLIAYSTELYTAPEIFRTGAVLDLIGLALLLTVVVSLWQLTGLV